MRSTLPVRACIGVLGPALAVSGCGATTDQAHEPSVSALSSAERPEAAPKAPSRYVLAISLDGFNPRAIKQLGRKRAPNLHRLIRNGASTLNARTEYERTITLPNHTGMLTGRRVNASHGGHGVNFNHDDGHTVHDAAGHNISSVFRAVSRHDRKTALFASKEKFAFFKRSWPGAVDRLTIDLNNARLVTKVRADLVAHPRAFTFLHLSLPDVVGHARGFMSPAYLRAVHKTDRRLGRLIHAIRNHRRLRKGMTVIVTADHGGAKGAHNHRDRTRRANYRVPFIVWGAAADDGKNLYALNPDYRNPGKKRPDYAARRQPIRNGDVANLALTLLGVSAVKGSEHDKLKNLLPYAHN